MKKTILIIALCVVSIGKMFSQTYESKTSKFQLTVFPPLSTNGKHASQYTNDFSFNIFVGISQNENKLALAGLANIIHNNARGIQIAGLMNYVGNEGSGIQYGGLGNKTGDYSGIQFGGVANVSDDVNGLQFAGLANKTNNLNGFQFAGLANKTDDLNGFQFAGLGNISHHVNGFQVAGIANISNDINGFQLAGIMNRAKHVNGFQAAAILNIADHNDYPIGLINIIKDGEMGVGISYNELGSTMFSFRSGGRVLYGIVGAGYSHRAVKNGFVIQGGIGAHINISPKFRINNELKGETISPFTKGDKTYKQSYSILPAYKFNSKLEVFAGPSINYIRSNNINNTDLFLSSHIWRRFNNSRLQQIYFGFEIGTQVVF